MSRVSLRDSAVIILDVNGAGTARLGPLTARETWYPSNVSIKTTFPGIQVGPTLESECDIFMGATASPENFRDKSYQGSSGDATGALSADRMVKGQYIWAVWSRGDAGMQATVTVTGMKDV